METSAIIFLVISCAISFGLGRTFVHFRDKKRARQAQERAAQTLRDQPAEAQALNRSKRKRQLQQLAKKSGRPAR
jgi:Flp pilus assembly protein TadB